MALKPIQPFESNIRTCASYTFNVWFLQRAPTASNVQRSHIVNGTHAALGLWETPFDAFYFVLCFIVMRGVKGWVTGAIDYILFQVAVGGDEAGPAGNGKE